MLNVLIIQSAKKEQKAAQPMSRMSHVLQWLMLLTMLLTLPMAWLVIELMFYYGTRHIPDYMLEQMWK